MLSQTEGEEDFYFLFDCDTKYPLSEWLPNVPV